MDAAIIAGLKGFIEEETPESFLRLRDAMAASPGYAPYRDSPDRADSLIDRGDFANAKVVLLSLMPSYFLNPGIHLRLSFVLHKLGDEKGAGAEFGLGMRCMEGILSTGSGDRARPYLVLHTDDEYDLLEHQSKKSTQQALVQKDDRSFDVHTCEDGSEVWFDITIPYSYLARSMEKK